MKKVVRVEFKENGPSYYFLANIDEIEKNKNVIVETERGLQYGKVITDLLEIDETILTSPLKSIVRIANRHDRKMNENNIREARRALKNCKELAIKYGLNISIIDAAYTFDRDQLLFHFVAESRVDFRELARTLASKYRTRIELRQVGVRDKAKQVGGVGSCGQKLCCNRFLKEFVPVSINMAKNQNIALNPTKINGSCGRLLCCLNYENDTYMENKKELPKVGSKVKINNVEGTVTEIDILNKKYTVDLPKIGQVVKEVTNGSNK